MRNLLWLLLVVGSLNAQQPIPADITFLTVDLKYSEAKGVKICEVQLGSLSKFYGFDWAEMGVGLTGEAFSTAVNERVNTLYYRKQDICDDRFLPVFRRYGWTLCKRLTDLKNDPEWSAMARTRPKDPTSLLSYPAALYVRKRTVGNVTQFRRRYPGILLIDASCINRGWNKVSMSKLFTGDLESLKPSWKSYPKQYSRELSQTILDDFSSNLLVIKPVASTLARGIIIVTRDELDATLRIILRKPKGLAANPDDSYSWWAKDKSAEFIVEEFAESDPTVMPGRGNRVFDPTIRVSFLLFYDKGEVDLVFLERHYVLPVKSLDEEGSLTELHKSRVQPPNYEHVATEIQEKVESQLRAPLLRLYRRMLEID